MISIRPETPVPRSNLIPKTNINSEDHTSLSFSAQRLREVEMLSETFERKANTVSSPTTSPSIAKPIGGVPEAMKSSPITMFGESAISEHNNFPDFESPLIFVSDSGAASPTSPSKNHQLVYSECSPLAHRIVQGTVERLEKLRGDETRSRRRRSFTDEEFQKKQLSPQKTTPVKSNTLEGFHNDLSSEWISRNGEQPDVQEERADVEREQRANEDDWSIVNHSNNLQISERDITNGDFVFVAKPVREQASQSPLRDNLEPDPKASHSLADHSKEVSAFLESLAIAIPKHEAPANSPQGSVSSGCVADLAVDVETDGSDDDPLNVSDRYDKVAFGTESTVYHLPLPCTGGLPTTAAPRENADSKHEAVVVTCENLELQSVSALRVDDSSWAGIEFKFSDESDNAEYRRVARQILNVQNPERRATTENGASSFLRFPMQNQTSRFLKDSYEDLRLERSPFPARNDKRRVSESSAGSPERPESRMGHRSPGSDDNLSDDSRLSPSPTRIEQMLTHGQIERTSGLRNLGNTCYMNSAIQALAHCIGFARFFLRKEYLLHLRNPEEGTLSLLFAQLLTRLWQRSDTTKVLKLFNRQIKARCAMYKSFEQQDSHEFLLKFLDLLHEDLKEAPRSGPEDPRDIPSVVASRTLSDRLNDFIAAHQERERSIVTSNFEGVLVSTLECQTCGKDSYTFEVFTVLSIPVPFSWRQPDLEACLSEFFKMETVDEWHCPQCNEKRTAHKGMKIAKLPENLIIHFIRCKDLFSPLVKTVNSRVNFSEDLDGRDIAQFLCTKDVQMKSYKLYAIVKHFGTSNYGHYVAECRSLRGIGQPWFRYSDDQVTPVSPDVDDAFMLFYSSVPQRSCTPSSPQSD